MPFWHGFHHIQDTFKFNNANVMVIPEKISDKERIKQKVKGYQELYTEIQATICLSAQYGVNVQGIANLFEIFVDQDGMSKGHS